MYSTHRNRFSFLVFVHDFAAGYASTNMSILECKLQQTIT